MTIRRRDRELTHTPVTIDGRMEHDGAALRPLRVQGVRIVDVQ